MGTGVSELSLSIVKEQGAACLCRRHIGTDQTTGDMSFVRSLGLYRTIRDLFG